MVFPCKLKQMIDGQWQARTMGSSVGTVAVVATTAQEALDNLKKEIRYRIEWCPCSGVAEDYINLDVHHINDRSLNHLKPYK